MIVALDSFLKVSDEVENTVENTDKPWFVKLGMTRPPKIGDVFLDMKHGDKYILSQVGFFKYCLICLCSFNRWQDPVGVGFHSCISEDEWNLIAGKEGFKKLDGHVRYELNL